MTARALLLLALPILLAGCQTAPEPEPAPPAAAAVAPAAVQMSGGSPSDLPPSVRRLVAEKGLDARKIPGTGPGGRISKGDVLLYLEQAPAGIPDSLTQPPSLCGKAR